MLYLVTILTIVLMMVLGDIEVTSPYGLFALGVGLSLAVTYRNQRRRKKKR
jgi:Mg2+/citrate symporter